MVAQGYAAGVEEPFQAKVNVHGLHRYYRVLMMSDRTSLRFTLEWLFTFSFMSGIRRMTGSSLRASYHFVAAGVVDLEMDAVWGSGEGGMIRGDEEEEGWE
ncbi:hypothetical protein BC835DRAFT_1365480 [Cytidiella melzeri]|nr:hypothetical protein BC835DRAFT_1398639 [Cytidiella melzeri]KAI0690275.1 hypothetical protein BC835DRAFT_1365480 [Cytidiella melzeri]